MDRIRKIHLLSLIETLQDLYDRGLDFVDFYKVPIHDLDQDGLGMAFCKEYMNEEFAERFETAFGALPEKENIDIKLSDEDLNQII